jgi:hypothetical protein
MKKSRNILISLATAALLALGCFTSLAHAQDRGTSKATIGNANVSVEYGRPALKGRDMLSKMQAGAVWRIGANEATTLTSDADLDFGGKRVAKGKHILLARLAEPGKWSLIVSTKGAFQFEEGAKLAEVPLEMKEAKDSVEELTLTLSNQGGKGVLEIAWGTARLVGSFAPAK